MLGFLYTMLSLVYVTFRDLLIVYQEESAWTGYNTIKQNSYVQKDESSLYISRCALTTEQLRKWINF